MKASELRRFAGGPYRQARFLVVKLLYAIWAAARLPGLSFRTNSLFRPVLLHSGLDSQSSFYWHFFPPMND